MALVFCTAGAMAQNAVKLTFNRTGTETSTVSVTTTDENNATVDGVTATCTGLNITNGNGTNAFKANANNLTASILCPNTVANGTYSPTIEMTFSISGLPADLAMYQIGLDIHPLNSKGEYQMEDEKNRMWDIEATVNDESFAVLDDINITPGVNSNPQHKVWLMDYSTLARTTGEETTLKLTITKGTTNEGCYFGLSEIIMHFYKKETIDAGLTGEKLTADVLAAATEPVYFAIKGIADNNTGYFNYNTEVNNGASSSISTLDETAVFAWEPAGESGKFYLRNITYGYMQKSGPGSYADTRDNAVIFEAVKPSTSATESHLQCNTNSINGDPGADYYVRFITTDGDTKKWLCLGAQQTSAQTPEYTGSRKGTVTYYQISEYNFGETIENIVASTTIKNSGDEDYATFYSALPVQIPEGIEAYYLEEAKIYKEYISLTKIESGKIPANTAVILRTAVNEETKYYFDLLEENITPIEGNSLKGTIVDTDITEAAYVLGNVNGVGLYKAKMTDGIWLNNANKAYLPASAVPSTAALSAGFRFDFDGTTAIEEVKGENGEVKTVYDLQGRRIDEITKPGIYVVNGNKVLVK